MKLLIMRHGEALPIGGSVKQDAERPLSANGASQVHQVAEGLHRRWPVLDGVLSSPLKRALETAQILAKAYRIKSVVTYAQLSSQASGEGIETLIKNHSPAETLLLVGHHPNVTVLIALLTGLDPSACPLFGAASVAALQWDPGKSKAELLWFQTSEQLIQS